MAIVLSEVPWARKDEAVAMGRIILFVSYAAYELEGAMFMFKSH